MTLDAHRDRTAIRLKLYQNGFTPLANKSKMCLIPGWSTIEVTPDLIKSAEWARSRKFQDTGIRCGDVIAIDIDVDDADLLNDLLDAVVEQGILPESPFVRIGMPPRELWVYRTSEKIGKRTTGHFMPPNPPEDHKGFAVEILGAGCQFAAFGQRDANTEYRWPGASLLDASYMDLPEITKAQADAVKEFAIRFFEQRGLERRSPAGGTDNGYTIAYDLTPDMAFEVHDMGTMTVEEIGDALRHSPTGEVLRCKVDALRPTTGSWAGMISLVDDRVCISDHGTYTSHFPEEADDGKALAKLGALLTERFATPSAPNKPEIVEPPRHKDDLDPRDTLDVNLAKALRRYVYIEGVDMVYDLLRPAAPMTVRGFQNLMQKYYEESPGPRGGTQVARLADMFMQHEDRLDAVSAEMRPDMPAPTYLEGGARHINTYRPQPALPTNGDATVGLDFIEHLLPVEAERQYFLQWLSYKYQHPAVRGPGIIMVAHDSFGTGRGSLVSLIRAMFSAELVGEIDFKTLAGTTYQSQYNEWLADNLIAVVNEAQETGAATTKWQVRSNAYERLKEVIEPGETHLHILRKGAKNTRGRSFCSIVVMTNHMDSVVLPREDRRLAILENGSPMPQTYWDAFHTWKANPANVGAFIAELLKVDLSSYSPYAPPPMTAAKADMVNAGSSEMDRLFSTVMRRYVDTVLVKEQVVLAMEQELMHSSAEVPDDWAHIAGRMFLRATRTITAVSDQVMIDDRVRTARFIGRPPADVVSDPEKMLSEIQRNGPVVRTVKSSGEVVQFPKRQAL
jgi:Family of unknown function (DUF5906)/Bifunctional DNA primase/polymerase, N-terminal